MAKVGAQRAAELTGRSKSTIQRAMNSGKLSYEIDANDRRIVDVSELDRVFGLKGSGGGSSESDDSSVEREMQRAAEMIENERMKMRIRMLEDQLDTAKDQIEDLKAQRDQWQKQAQQVLITSQYSQKQAEEYKEELRLRDERARQRKEELDRRMMDLKGQSQNQNSAQRPAQPVSRPITEAKQNAAQQGANASAGKTAESGSFQGLWAKIKGGKATA